MKNQRDLVKRAVGRGFTTGAEVTKATGLTSETVRLHLNALAEDGEIEAKNGKASGTPGRPARVFRKN